MGDTHQSPAAVDAKAIAGGHFRYYDFVMVAFVVVLLLSNVIGAEKRAVIDLPGIGPWPFGAGILFFPISYVIDDVLTEVYGYARARRVIWAGFVALAFMGVMGGRSFACPWREGWTGQAAYERVFGGGWRIVLASLGVLGGRSAQLLGAGADEDLDRGALAVDANDRQHDRGRGGGQPDLLSARVSGRCPIGRCRRC